jgi:hypothetical protein
MTLDDLEEFRDAWARADLERLMSFMSDDCVYRASVGPEPGEVFVGAAAVRAGFAHMLAHDAGKEGRSGRCFVYGDRGVAQWSYVYFEGNRRVEVFGCDLFEFVGEKIRVKDAFRKTFDR